MTMRTVLKVFSLATGLAALGVAEWAILFAEGETLDRLMLFVFLNGTASAMSSVGGWMG